MSFPSPQQLICSFLDILEKGSELIRGHVLFQHISYFSIQLSSRLPILRREHYHMIRIHISHGLVFLNKEIYMLNEGPILLKFAEESSVSAIPHQTDDSITIRKDTVVLPPFLAR